MMKFISNVCISIKKKIIEQLSNMAKQTLSVLVHDKFHSFFQVNLTICFDVLSHFYLHYILYMESPALESGNTLFSDYPKSTSQNYPSKILSVSSLDIGRILI